MALVQGYEGSGTFGPINMKFTAWSLTINQDTTETTGLGEEWDDHVPAGKSWTATVNGFAYADSGSDPIDWSGAISGGIYLQAQDGDFYSGVGITTSFETNKDAQGLNPITVNIQGKGDLTRGWTNS